MSPPADDVTTKAGGSTVDPPAAAHAGFSAPTTKLGGAREVHTDVIGLGRTRAVGFVTPAFLLIAGFLIFPAFYTLYLGVTNYRLTGPEALRPAFVGLGNYRTALDDPTFYNAVWLTVLFVLGSAVIGQNALGFALAWTLRAAPVVVRRTVEALVMLAWILPSTVIAFLWIALLTGDEGSLNVLLGTDGLSWLVRYPVASIIVFNIWRGTAFSMMLYSAALASVPPSHLETARLAGASTAQTLRDAVFPHIRGHVLTNTLLITLWTFNDFTPFLLTGGGPVGPDGEGRSEILAVYIYNTALRKEALGYAGAISVLVLLVNLVMALAYLRVLRRRQA